MPLDMHPVETVALKSADAKFEKHTIKRNVCGPDDVLVDIKFCGICHSDVHVGRNEIPDLMPTKYPCVPGHEIAGIVNKVGKNVTDVKAGDHVGVGCFVDSCRNCTACKTGNENACKGPAAVFTIQGMTTLYDRVATDTGVGQGGFSKSITVPRRFVFKVPKGYPLKSAGPVFCSAITCYTPLKMWGATKGGMRVGIAGIGGLGQMGIQLAAAMGNEVTAISTSPRKKDAAMELGAKHFVVSTDEECTKKAAGSLDLIINTISAKHQVGAYLPLLDFRGKICSVGGGADLSQVRTLYFDQLSQETAI